MLGIGTENRAESAPVAKANVIEMLPPEARHTVAPFRPSPFYPPPAYGIPSRSELVSGAAARDETAFAVSSRMRNTLTWPNFSINPVNLGASSGVITECIMSAVGWMNFDKTAFSAL